MQNTLTRIRQWLAGLIVLDIVVSLVPYLTIRSLEYHRHNDALFHFSLPVAAELIIGLFIPLLMLVFARSIKKELPAVLILLGVVLKRWHIVIPGLTHHALPYPPADYVPNSIEWLICLCFVSLFGLMMSFLNELPTLIPDNQNS